MIQNILASFDNSNAGFSARKLTAFWLVVLLTYIEGRYTNSENLVEIAIIDVCGAFLCLGIITAEQIINLRSGNTITSKQEATITETKSEKGEDA